MRSPSLFLFYHPSFFFFYNNTGTVTLKPIQPRTIHRATTSTRLQSGRNRLGLVATDQWVAQGKLTTKLPRKSTLLPLSFLNGSCVGKKTLVTIHSCADVASSYCYYDVAALHGLLGTVPAPSSRTTNPEHRQAKRCSRCFKLPKKATKCVLFRTHTHTCTTSAARAHRTGLPFSTLGSCCALVLIRMPRIADATQQSSQGHHFDPKRHYVVRNISLNAARH